MTSEFDEQDLGGLIAQEIRHAQDYDQTELSERRARAIEYLRGEMNDTPARPNGSTVTSRDVNDTISWMLPGIMRVFMASDRMADYDPSPPDVPDETAYQQAEDHADQASDYASHVFMKDNDGYRVVYNATHNALTTGDGVVKHWWDDTPVTTVTHHSCLTLEQVTQLTESEGVEVLASTRADYPEMMPDPETNEMVPVETYDVKIERTTQKGRIRIEAIAPEDFLIDEAATCIEDARFCAHRDQFVTRSDLIEMGFDREKVESLAADSNALIDSEEGYARRQDISLLSQSSIRSMERLDYYECFLKIDVDGDGVAETVRVDYVGDAGAGTVLEWEVWEDGVPFSIVPCYPRPHRFDSESVADRTMDIQQIKTTLLRGALENTYWTNLPMREADQGSVLNPDALVNPKFGGIIWKKPSSQPVLPHVVPYTADKSFAAAEYFDRVMEKRTGVSQTMMALDPEALQNQSATANQNAHDAAYSQVELVARNMAELGWRRVFREILKLMVKHQDRPRIIRLRGKFVPMDPRVWNADMDCTVNVGLGTGSRDRDMSMLNTLLAQQYHMLDRLMNSGIFAKAADLIPKIIRTHVRIAESAGLRNPEDYWPQFEGEELEQLRQMFEEKSSQPSEVMQIEQAKMQSQMQLEQAKMQLQQQVEQLKIQAQQQAEELKARGNQVKEQAQLEADMQTRRADMEKEMVLTEREQSHADQMEARKLGVEAQLKREDMQTRIFIEQMKQGAAKEARAETEDGKAAKTYKDTMDQIAKSIEELAQARSAPRNLLRDDTGRVVGVDVGGMVYNLDRDEAGRVMGASPNA